MEGLRVVEAEKSLAPCARCQTAGCPWDRIAGEIVCPDCQELLVLGEGAPLVVRVEPRCCAVCGQRGTIRYLTHPLHTRQPVEIDLCALHFRTLLGRRLDRSSLEQLGRQLQTLGLSPRQVFLLHEAFYDDNGKALQPVSDGR